MRATNNGIIRQIAWGALFVAIGFLRLPSTSAQTVYGALYGSVLDKSGAVIQNATIVVTSEQKGTSFKTQTNSVGQYRLDHLVPDTYVVTISAPGFKSYTVGGLQINAGDTPNVNANLEVGAVNQSVTVAAGAEQLLKTESQDVSLSVPQETVQQLPLVNQSMSNVLLLTPGAYAALGQMGVQALNPAGGSEYAVNGQPVGGANFVLDGTDNTGQTLGYIVVNPAPNTIQNVKINTTSFVAETGRTLGADIEMQTRSGTNSFHGLVSDTRQSAANLGRNPYSAAQSAPHNIAPGLYNQPEFNIGGPIFRDHLFFFFDYFGLRQREGGSVLTTLPTAHLEQTCLGAAPTSNGTQGCDFGEYLTLLGPTLGTIYQSNGQPYPDNIIPANQLSPQALGLLKMLPAPNIANSVYDNYSVNTTGVANTNQFTTRVDDQLTSRMHAFGRWTYYRDDLIGHPVFGLAGGPSGVSEAGHGTGRTHSVALGLDDAISDHLLMDARLGYYEDHLTDDMANANLNLGTQLGIPGLNGTGYPMSNGEPVFNIAAVSGGGIGSTQIGGSPSTPVRQREDQFQITNNWTWIRGTHTLKAGLDLRYGRENREESFDSRTGNMTFGTGPTSNGGVGGLGLATFILGDVTNFIRDVSQVLSPKENQWRTFYYAQDTWRVTQKLILNLGGRWEIYYPEKVDAKGHGALLNLNTGMLQVAGYGPYGMNMGQTVNLSDLAPRVGLSYQLNDKTVLRAGYGRSFSQANYGSIFSQVPVESPPVYGTQNLQASSITGSVFNLSQGPPGFPFAAVPPSGQLPVPAGVTVAARRGPELMIPSVDSWNLSFQRALTPKLSLTAAYVGNKGTHTYVGDWMYTFPNEPQAVLPASESSTGSTLYFDPGAPTSGVAANGHTSDYSLLRPYYAKYGWKQDIYYYAMAGDTHYNALQITAQEQYSHGLAMTVNYAYQVARNYDSGGFYTNKKAVYGPTDMNFNQVLTAFGYYQLPFGRKADFFTNVPRWVDALIGGYQLTPSINISSGQHFNLTYTNCGTVLPQQPGSTDIRAENASQPCYPNINGSFPMHLGPYNPVTHSRSYFTPVATLTTTHPTSGPFSIPTLDTVGNLKRNAYTAPGTWNVDLAAAKTIPIHENVTAEFRVNAFNAFNHINPGPPTPFYPQFGLSASVDNPYIGGKILNAALGTTPRQLNFELTLQF